MQYEFEIGYALAKQLPGAYLLGSNYGGIELDAELHRAVVDAVKPILLRRLEDAKAQAEKEVD